MASSVFTLADGAGSATSVGTSSTPSGLNVTAGNTVNGQVVDMSGVVGFSARTIWNNLGLTDQVFSQSNFTINQATGAFSFPAGSVEGAAYIVEVAIVQSTLAPTVQRSLVGVYVSKQGSYRVNFANGMSQAAMIAALSAPFAMPSGDPNAAFMDGYSTTNAQGSGGPTLIAVAQLTCSASGIFDYVILASAAAAAAADVVTWTVTSQTGTGAVAFTGNGAAGQGCQVATGVAGTGIVISTGGGGAITHGTFAKTIGTAAVGDTVYAAGVLQNVTGSAVLTPFTRGSNVFLGLSITDSVANRVVSNISLSLRERLYA